MLCINTKKFTSDEVAAFDNLPQAVPVLESNIPTVEEPILIDVKAFAADPADAYDINDARAQFDSGADTTVTNLPVYLHDYKPYNRKFKCPV